MFNFIETWHSDIRGLLETISFRNVVQISEIKDLRACYHHYRKTKIMCKTDEKNVWYRAINDSISEAFLNGKRPF